MLNEAAARRYWGGDDPVNAFGRFNDPAGPRFQVVGVVDDVKNARSGRTDRSGSLPAELDPEIRVDERGDALDEVRGLAAARHSPRRPEHRSGAADSRRRDDARHHQADDDAPARGVIHDDAVRGRGAVDGDARSLWRGLLFRAAAHGRDRHADGARRHQPRRVLPHRRWRTEDGGDRCRDRRGGRDCGRDRISAGCAGSARSVRSPSCMPP